MSTDRYACYRQALAGLPLPHAWIDMDALDRNAALVLRRAGDLPVRIASKSIRCTHILRYLLRLNPRFQGIMAYSLAEAAWLSQQGFDDILVGYPGVQAADLQAVCAEIRAGKKIIPMVDSAAHVQALGAAARAAGVQMEICLEADMSSEFPGLYFGVRRSPVRTVAQALAVWEAVKAWPELQLTAVMGYEAQIAGVADKVPGKGLKNAVLGLLKRRSVRELSQRRQDIIAALRQAGAPLRLLNGGGTGSLESTRQETGLTEVAAGSAFYCPGVFDHYAQFQHEPAAGFSLEICRIPAPGHLTLLGGGYIASGAAGPEKLPRPWLPAGMKLLSHEGAGEVQTPVQYHGKTPLQVGDPVFFRHAKAGELCERFTHLHLLRNCAVTETVPTYRGEGQCFI